MNEPHNPYQAPGANVEDRSQLDDGPLRIGGWLYLLGLGLIIRTVLLPVSIWGLFGPYLMQPESWGQIELLPNAAGLRALIIIEVVVNALMWGLTVWSTILFVQRKTRFKRIFLLLLLVSFLFYTADHFIAGALLPAELLEDQGESVKLIWQSLIYGLIWGNYVLRSERVERTFVE